jgi:trans-aconitate 2-methyltransferase
MTTQAGPRDWNAASYHRVSSPHQDWGSDVVGRLELRGDESVLDLGCGTGRVTALLLERLPRGRAVAVDAAPAMVERAREELSERATVVLSDLLDLEVDEPVDAAISTATLHWIADHDALFARVAAALKPGGQFVAQCGGAGNIASVVEVLDRVGAEVSFAPFLAGWPGPWNFAAPDETAARLRRAGFDVQDCWLQASPVVPDDPREFLETVVLGSHLARLPEQVRGAYVDRVAGALADPPTLDFVRLNFVARRASST